ncbi:MAG: prepilin-type N-terminal cleavage/methylation domain-containing protein [Chitinivibrionales bacterium]|nr:prepilin-type N-terminal cleavage/methylation domain-containing protein [Chitinivibrionales bacterium]
MKRLKNKGFTLVELMVVIVIVGILAAVAIPKMSAASDKARASEFTTILTSIFTAEEAFKAEIGTYADEFGEETGAGQLGIVDPSSQSKWFTYSWPAAATATSYEAQADVAQDFGKVEAGTDNATIDNDGDKTVTNELGKLAPNW